MSNDEDIAQLFDATAKLQETALDLEEIAQLRQSPVLDVLLPALGDVAENLGLTAGMAALRMHERTPWPPNAFRLVTVAEREQCGLGDGSLVAHVMVRFDDGNKRAASTAYFCDPPPALLKLLRLVGDGIPAPTVHELKAAGWRPAGKQPIQENSPAWD
jgi:hypothetical protein